MVRYIFVLVVFLLFAWRSKKGFDNGVIQEIATVLSGTVALICVALILFAITSAKVKAIGTLTLCIVALILLGIIYKVCCLIFTPLLALSHISIIEGVSKILGVLMGLLEAGILTGLLYYVLDYMGVYVF